VHSNKSASSQAYNLRSLLARQADLDGARQLWRAVMSQLEQARGGDMARSIRQIALGCGRPAGLGQSPSMDGE
jgi:hypothetical protein